MGPVGAASSVEETGIVGLMLYSRCTVLSTDAVNTVDLEGVLGSVGETGGRGATFTIPYPRSLGCASSGRADEVYTKIESGGFHRFRPL